MTATYPSLKDRTVLVTGGGSGIGAAIVTSFAGQGARVAFLDIDSTASERTVAGNAVAAYRPLFIRCDLADTTALAKSITRIEAECGPVRVLVNNAANDQRDAAGTLTQASWDTSMAVNLRPQFFAAQCVHAGMTAAGGGAIINFSSVAFMFGAADMIAYSTAKSAVIGLTTALAAAYGGDNIRVNAIAPGAVMTEKQLRLWHTPETTRALVAKQAIKTSVTEQDIADAVLFLASDQARMITKQCLVVDGGLR